MPWLAGYTYIIPYIIIVVNKKMPNFKLNLNISRFERELNKKLTKNMRSVAARLAAFVVESFGPSNQGGKNPSRPGSPPNVGTSMLRSSITHGVDTDGKDIVGFYGVRKGPASAYAKRLELGFVGRDSKGRNYNQQPRPFLRPALEKNRKMIRRILGS